MDLQDIEFITVKDEIELKAEYLDNVDGDALELDVYGYKAKCGEIVVSICGSFTLICAFCDDEFADMPSFGNHIQLKHLDDDMEDVPTVVAPAKKFELHTEEVLLEEPHLEEVPLEEPHLDEAHLEKVPSEEIRLEEVDSEEVSNEILSNLTGDSQFPIENRCNDETIEITVLDPGSFCKICNRQFKTRAAFASHQNTHKLRRPLDFAYSSHRNLQKPRPLKIEKRRITSRAVRPRTSSKSSAASEQAPDPSMFCEICDHQFRSKRAFRDHGPSHGNLIPLALQQDPTYLKCKYCNEEFASGSERAAHEFAHGAGERFVCSYCPKNFRTNFQRLMHIYTHTGERPYKCKLCPKAFASYINKLQHERIHLGIKNYFCDICKKRFVSSSECSIHVRSHTGERPYQCDECGQRFITSSSLCSHKRRHTNVRDFKCDVCAATFFYKYDLTKHKISHTDIRPFKCTVCGRDFQRKRALNIHGKIHLAVKQYACTICGKEFAQKAGLHSHKKTHGEKLGVKVGGWF